MREMSRRRVVLHTHEEDFPQRVSASGKRAPGHSLRRVGWIFCRASSTRQPSSRLISLFVHEPDLVS